MLLSELSLLAQYRGSYRSPSEATSDRCFGSPADIQRLCWHERALRACTPPVVITDASVERAVDTQGREDVTVWSLPPGETTRYTVHTERGRRAILRGLRRPFHVPLPLVFTLVSDLGDARVRFPRRSPAGGAKNIKDVLPDATLATLAWLLVLTLVGIVALGVLLWLGAKTHRR